MIRHFFFAVIGLLLLSCGTKSDKIDALIFELTGQTKQLQLPEGWGQFNLGWRVSPAGNILVINNPTSEIAIYKDIEDASPLVIKLEEDGPDGLDGPRQDIQWGYDESFWVSTFGDKLIQFDAEGTILQRVSIPTERLLAQNVSLLNFNFIVEESSIYFPAAPLTFAWNTLSVEEIQKTPNLLRLDLESNEISVVSTYSTDFLGTNLNKNIMPTLFRGLNGAVIINHNFKDIWAFQEGELLQKEVSFSQFSPMPPSSSKDIFEDMDEIMRLLNYSDAYWELFPLPKQQLLARIVKFEEKPEEEVFGMEFIPSKWGMILVNSTYEKQGEFLFPSNSYNPQLLYSDLAGMWVCTTHPNRADIEEGVLVFELLITK
ncbi:DUF4221 family protein [Mongoliitalea daihaiensis]|uniref:DUF4221 family protein n=1 Tax=Mongoliitalea daihaiensis TaxID=2782006 RepID=UPI001F1A7386|nr:DUF4221 family protein [Mongoliitalea daihaiensis]UJP63537.1 DUF4221 family protein [Mongoliitalea daihaiensis]